MCRFATDELKVIVRTNAMLLGKCQVISQPITTNTIQLQKPGLAFLSFVSTLLIKFYKTFYWGTQVRGAIHRETLSFFRLEKYEDVDTAFEKKARFITFFQ
jgi:hypothetical protein